MSNRHPDQLTTKSNGNRSRQDDRGTLPTSGDTIRSNRHPDKMRQDNREPPDMRTAAPRPTDNQPTQRRATRKATNRPDMSSSTPRQLESMSSTPTPEEQRQPIGNQSPPRSYIYIIRYKGTATDKQPPRQATNKQESTEQM